MTLLPVKVYRIAVYGRSNSGKTCMLAALAMPRVPNPDGLSCTWLPGPTGRMGAIAAEAHRQGQNAVETCKAAIEKGQRPPPTAPSMVFPRLRFDFTILAPSPHTYRVELIDYSGELIDPKVNAGQMATNLRRHLCEVDGLLVLAEAPRPQQENARLFEEFERLKQAFAILHNERSNEPALQVPVGLILNKWDRRHPGGSTAPEREQQVKEFLASRPFPPHLDLANALRGAVAEGCFRVFAASAFGQTRSITVTDADGRTAVDEDCPPVATPLPSFGLEEPFVWAARQRDAIDVAALHEEAGQLTYTNRWPWLYANAVAFWTAGQLWRQARRMGQRFTREQEEFVTVRQARRRTRDIASSRLITFLLVVPLLLALAGEVMEATIDGIQKRNVLDHLGQPDRSAEQLAVDEAWLHDYVTAPGFRHLLFRQLFFSRPEAQQSLAQFRDRRESIPWSKVEAAPDDLAKEAPALEYLRLHGNGKYAEDAHKIVQHAEDARHQQERTRKQRENALHIQNVRGSFAKERATGFPNADVLQQLLKQLDKLPHSAQETDEHFAGRKQLREEIGSALVVQGKREWIERFQLLLGNGQFREAANLLARQQPLPLDLKKKFRQKAMDRVKNDFDRYVAEQRWRDAQDCLKRLHGDEKVVGLLNGDDLTALDRYQAEGRQAEDRYLYHQVRKYKDLARADRYLADRYLADRYLKDSQLKTMEKPVAKYREYLLDQGRAIKLTVQLSEIVWEEPWEGNTDYEVTLKGQTVMAGLVEAKKKTTSKGIAAHSVNYRLDDTVQLEVKMKHRGTFKDTDYPALPWEGKVRDLDGLRLKVVDRFEVVFALDGVPREPALPPYKEK